MVVAQTQTGVVALLLCKGSFGNITGGFKDRYIGTSMDIGTSMAVFGLCVFSGVCGGDLVVASTVLMHEGGGTIQTST